ncbi:baseplate protein [Vibrio parahaemolyticus]|uniref:baseplate protein n=1 Tax=Vibrio parahaemolyticus TaxID=670 RepID=UPI000C9D0C0A|nr:baseplate protein [Vibrio parahaemolyticus]EGQ7810299.1 baseplate protein [Vibrio parahaemolyticus]PMS91992.1 baseplate protein [Vibrio parahaemolyticus]HBN6266144.1 baseplate protein [Vibrio parahaemolyticus]
MAGLSRLSDLNITDPILRGHFYLRIMEYVKKGSSELTSYTIKIDEEYRYDLASQRAFGTPSLDWLIALVAGNIDMSYPLPLGETLKFPTPAWIRQDMRDFMDEMGITDAS